VCTTCRISFLNKVKRWLVFDAATGVFWYSLCGSSLLHVGGKSRGRRSGVEAVQDMVRRVDYWDELEGVL
jgi:hypothetical protein